MSFSIITKQRIPTPLLTFPNFLLRAVHACTPSETEPGENSLNRLKLTLRSIINRHGQQRPRVEFASVDRSVDRPSIFCNGCKADKNDDRIHASWSENDCVALV
ncbi:hypothetical protein F5878DRAFT_645186 [Lentinula raphanica]|uniref:Uncharacterized protein n=1 Tax=Lentinula raphanica TaxID=153919 RepID=A0AA38U9S2_9AGAR|nr:hypothetical protein EV360DRAFT_65877 [Lentinula raphanica]KAJ3834375.1 hypothetical protein F5878DRAFT_645186 [Lentinula raphanica]